MGVSITPFAMVPPGPPFSASKDEKHKYPKISVITVDLKDYPDLHEVLGANVYIDTRLYNGHNVSVSAKFYNDATGKFLWGDSHTISQPSSEGWEWWNWFRLYFIIGHASWEIDGPMKVRIEVSVTGDPIGAVSETLYIDVIDTSIPPEPPPPPPPETWLSKAKRFITETLPMWLIEVPKAMIASVKNASMIIYIRKHLVPDAIQEAKDYASALLQGLETIIPQWIVDAYNWITNVAKDAVNWINETARDVIEDVRDWWAKVRHYVGVQVQGLKDWVTEQWHNIKDWYLEVDGKIINFLEYMRGKVGEWLTEFKDLIITFIPQFIFDTVNWVRSTAIPAVNSFIANFPALFNDFYYFMFHPWEKVEEGIVYIIEKIRPSDEEIEDEFKQEKPLPPV